jgi:hypothetical protein
VRGGGIGDDDQTFYTIDKFLWEDCERLWGDQTQQTSSIRYDTQDNLYVVEVVVQQPPVLFRFHVDPNKDFIPVRREWCKADGTVLRQYTCERMSRENGLWVPTEFSWVSPGNAWCVHYSVQKVAVNEPIEEALLDFTFPPGTVVKDEIAGLVYTVDAHPGPSALGESTARGIVASDGTGAVDREAPLQKDDILMPRVADERDLSSAHEKAAEILGQRGMPRENEASLLRWVLFCVVVLCVCVGLISLWRIRHPRGSKETDASVTR